MADWTEYAEIQGRREGRALENAAYEERIAALEAQLAERDARLDRLRAAESKAERELAEKDRQIERLRDAVEPLVKAMAHIPDDVPDMPMAVKMLGEDLYALREALAALATEHDERRS